MSGRRLVWAPAVIVSAMAALSPVACERSSTQVQGPSGPKQELTAEDLGVRLVELNRRLEKEPEAVDAFIERGHVQRRLAELESGDRVWKLYEAAWDDFRTAHELSGGIWDFPNVLDVLRAAQKGKPPPASPPAGVGQRRAGSVKALLGASVLCGRLYQFELAGRLLERAAELDPNDPGVVPRMINLRALADGNWRRAQDELKRLGNQPVFKDADYYWFALGYASQEVGDLEEAERAYRRAMTLSDEPWAARANLIAVLGRMGKYEEQAVLAREARVANLNDVYAQNNYGADLVDAKRYTEAAAILQPLMDRNPGFPMGWLNLGRAYRGLREHERAIQALHNALKLVPQFPQAWHHLAWAYADAGRTEDAVDAYRKLLELVPQGASARCGYADLLARLGRRQEAEEAFREALRLQPDAEEGWRGLARLLLGEKRYPEARSAALRAIELDPNSTGAIRLMGDLELAEQQPEAAVKWYRQVLALQPENQAVFWSLCVALVQSGKSGEALDLIENELKKRPETPALYSCRATVRFARGELAEAESDYTHAQELRPSPEGLRMRGLVRVLRGNPETAVEDLRRSLEMDPSDGYSALLLWVVESDAGRRDAAEAVLQEARKHVDPNGWTGRLLGGVIGELSADELLSTAEDDDQRCEAYYYLAERARAAGQAAEARVWLEKCVATEKTSSAEYRLARRRLEQP